MMKLAKNHVSANRIKKSPLNEEIKDSSPWHSDCSDIIGVGCYRVSHWG
jgi:hypothetical protein